MADDATVPQAQRPRPSEKEATASAPAPPPTPDAPRSSAAERAPAPSEAAPPGVTSGHAQNKKRKKKKDLACAMLWYYKDTDGGRRGPFYPGQMRRWYEAGYLPPTQLLAASFKGEVPRDFERLDALFAGTDDDRDAKAFVAAEGVALWPPAAPEGRGGSTTTGTTTTTTDAASGPAGDSDDDSDVDEETRDARERMRREAQRRERPRWLQDSLQRQRAGIKRKMIYGPVERENYN